MDLGDYLNSINMTKQNVMKESDSPESAEKMYPPFPVARSLSYSPDALFYVNELNQRGLVTFGVNHRMHYDYLLYSLPKKKRFAKWAKPEKDEKIQLIQAVYKYSYGKAAAVVDLFSDEQIEILYKSLEKGGSTTKITKRAKK